jgi:hypothetical protein
MHKLISGLVALTLTTPALALDLKGVELGKRVDTAQLERELGVNFDEHKMDPCHGRIGVVYTCQGGTRVNGLPAVITVTIGALNTVEQITARVLTPNFDELVGGAIAKWGKPVTSTVVMQNGFGAKLTNVEHLWIQPDFSSVSLLEFDAEAKWSTLTLETEAFATRAREQLHGTPTERRM